MPHHEVDPWVEKLEWLLDRSIPVGRWSIGLDPILGLVPGAGDAVSGLISMAMIARAIQVGVPKPTVMRMLTNLGIDTVVGSVPIVGSMFDFVYKANTRNIGMYKEALRGTRDSRRDTAFMAFVVIAAIIIILAPLVLVAWLLGWLWQR